MARIRSSAEAQFSTDFALINFEQEAGTDLEAGTYATSAPGAVAMQAGTKYAELDVRVECWDGEPPPADDVWEDRDVLPWRAIEGSSVASLRGFDAVDGTEVALECLEQARVEILAAGRNRYSYSAGPADEDWDSVSRERWLLRLWPDPVGMDAMAGPPRRLIGRSWLPSPVGAFTAAVKALKTTGWSALGGPFDEIFRALLFQGAAFRVEDLPPPFLNWTWETEVTRGRNSIADARLERIECAANIEIRTFRDGLLALVGLGVFATVSSPSGDLLVPNPAPPVSPWELLEPSETIGYLSPRAFEFDEYRTVSEDLVHLARWAPNGVLHATPERIATRLGISPDDAIGALSFLAALGHRVDPLLARDAEWHEPVSVAAAIQEPTS